MKSENKTNQLHSITFRVSPEDKSKLSKLAEELNISLSEYVRNRAFMDDEKLQARMADSINLKQENNELGTIIINLNEENKSLIKKILSFAHWNRFNKHPKQVESDYELSKAITFILVEYLVEPINDMRGLRSRENFNTVEDLYNTIAGYYME